MTKDFAVYGADLLPWEAGWLCLLGWSTSDRQRAASVEMPPEIFVLPQP